MRDESSDALFLCKLADVLNHTGRLVAEGENGIDLRCNCQEGMDQWRKGEMR
jgi:hypothetical protein